MADVQPDSSPRSAPAIISYIILATFVLTQIGVFTVKVMAHVELDSTFSSIIGQIIGIEGTSVGAVGGYWLASSLNANRSNAAKDAVIAQALGTGAPPPNPPTDTTGQATAGSPVLKNPEEPDAPPAAQPDPLLTPDH